MYKTPLLPSELSPPPQHVPRAFVQEAMFQCSGGCHRLPFFPCGMHFLLRAPPCPRNRVQCPPRFMSMLLAVVCLSPRNFGFVLFLDTLGLRNKGRGSCPFLKPETHLFPIPLFPHQRTAPTPSLTKHSIRRTLSVVLFPTSPWPF